jgi:hypothetical protein
MTWNDLALKYHQRLKDRRGGIFSKSSRERLLGLTKSYSGRYAGNTLLNFWNRIIEYVSTTFIDLELFIETTGRDNRSKVINIETIEPLFNTYFQIGKGKFTEKDSTKADVARLLIAYSFKYLSWLNKEPKQMSDSEKKIVDDALALSNNLTIRMKNSINEVSEKSS